MTPWSVRATPEALAAHRRQPPGRMYVHLHDAPESAAERAAEQARKRALARLERKREEAINGR